MINLHQLMAIILLTILSGANSYSQIPGTLDSSFAINGMQILKPSNGFENANELVILPDDKIVGVGFTTGPLGDWDLAAFRLHADGTVDSTFGVNGLTIFDIAGNYDYGNAIYRLNDGKLLIAGGATLPNWSDIDYFVARLNEDGSIDESFGTGGISQIHADGSEDLFYSLAVQPDGKILAVGQDQRAGQTLIDGIIMRLEADGKVDSTFGTNGIVKTDIEYDYSLFRDLLLNEDGSIIAAGNCANDNYDILLAKYDNDGQPDATFGNNGIKVHNLNTGTDDAFAIMRHPIDGRILIGGRIGHGSSKTDMLLMAIDESGAIDSAFGVDGLSIQDVKSAETFTDMTVQTNGKIVMCGTSGGTGLGSNDWLVARFNEDGTVDSSFGQSGGYTITEAGSFFSEADGVALQSTGRIITVGIAANDNNDMGILAYYGDDIATGMGAIQTSAQSTVSAYPNPSSGAFTLTLKTDENMEGDVRVQIINQVGQIMYEHSAELQRGSFTQEFNENIVTQSGIYLVKVIAGAKEFTGKVLIEK
jgi:uncharacterized delta-60 repeat protein